MKYPEFLPILCKAHMRAHVICVDVQQPSQNQTTQSIGAHHLTTVANTMCNGNWILYQNSCYYVTRKLNRKMGDKRRLVVEYGKFSNIMTLFSKVNHRKLHFGFSFNLEGYILLARFDKLSQRFVQKISLMNVTNSHKQLFFVLTKRTKADSLDRLFFEVQLLDCNGTYINMLSFYFSNKNCSGKQQNSNVASANKNVSLSRNLHAECLRPSCKCSDMFHLTKRQNCVPFVSLYTWARLPRRPSKNDSSSGFHSGRNESEEEMDLYEHGDCERLEMDKVKNNTQLLKEGCAEPDHMLCTLGCQKCFPTIKLCVFELDTFGHQMYCPSGAHLKYCREMECTNMVKCHVAYCVPFR